jgi:hypothetical protein
MLARHLGTQDQVFVSDVARFVLQRQNLAADYVPQAGSILEVPYSNGYRGEVTALGIDADDRLWVGTDLGVFRLYRGNWRSFGYRAVTVTEGTAPEAIAEERLGTRATPERVAWLAERIRQYNGLTDNEVEAGRTVYVYRNPAGSRVSAFGLQDELFLVSTEYGQLEREAGRWNRYYHAGLESESIKAILPVGNDIWFVADNRLVVYQRPPEEVSLMHSPWLPDFNLDLFYDYGAWIKNLKGIGTLGMAIRFLSYGEIISTNEFGKEVDQFHSFDGSLSLSYGTALNRNLFAGLTAKVVYSRLSPQGAVGAEIGSGSATAFALDAGILYRTPWRRLTLGLAATNVGPNISYIDAQQSDPLPRNLALGLSYKLWDSPFNRLILAIDINKELVDLSESTSDELKQIIYNFGAEYSYASTVAFRIGYVYDEDGEVKVPTLGGGLAYRIFRLDFAYIWASRDDTPLANTVRYGVTLRFQ